ncbi:exodeoxyribonuclease 7 large subunit [Ktedonobacter sp. SOSP1-52]|uniref:exodeoxyribonuclease VII large subunit n=1 Tax=Ktedonobacter sp. SOSP1-52 TaxID=2778366 RepID=UPI001915297C|nr:exodeoxyribonuclease VII large subunit [Ktedonobacter sp. SOSP1-52]GHO65804.1 exodeoxyribonuclease 7 large subunit [Ktedonobacter sp. SOSP1-52]
MTAMHLPGFNEAISVSALSVFLREWLETNDMLQDVRVYGEVSNCKTYPSGHCYFTLKDSGAQLNCVFFKQSRLRSSAPTLRDGMGIALNGRISFYERDGKLQLYVESAEPLGVGALFERLERLKARLEAEGLFAEERKRVLPERPEVIGIVTSPQAAALRDMLRVLRQRYPLARVILAPAQVQGSEAPASIAAALDALNEHGEAEVIIAGRGGGSIEELWAFNEEVVVRAIARSSIPVISGVGHETDFTLADFVADLRASTPTAAATAAVPNIEDWRIELLDRQQELGSLMEERLEALATQVADLQYQLEHKSPVGQINNYRQQLDEASERLQTHMRHLLSIRAERLSGQTLQLHALSPLLTITRGYAVVRQEPGQRLITSVKQVQAGDALSIQVQDGSIPVSVREELG